MIDRRQLIAGGACIAAAAAAAGLRPRVRQSLLGDAKIEDLVPRAFADWRESNLGQVVQPREEGSLSAQLYDQILGRVYENRDAGEAVMLAIAYGNTQSDVLQLHRPEYCYRSFGFELSQLDTRVIPLGPGSPLGTRTLVATAPGRRETISYWTRIGEYLPNSQRQQTIDKLKTSIDGYIADGMLVRCSTIGDDTPQLLDVLARFQTEMIAAMAPGARAPFIGTALAKRLAAGVAPSLRKD